MRTTFSWQETRERGGACIHEDKDMTAIPATVIARTDDQAVILTLEHLQAHELDPKKGIIFQRHMRTK